MKPEIKEAWIAALESGQYEQGQGYLHRLDPDNKDTYCCLGVLCELATEAGICEKFNFTPLTIAYDGRSFHLPESVMRWAGLDNDCGRYSLEQDEPTLAMLNDDQDNPSSFKKIAAVIKEKFG